MGDYHGLIPMSDSAKSKGDVVAVSTAALAYFKAIPWAEIAAFLACIYTALRIAEMLWSAWRKRKQ